jgi:hypothetical protein
MINDVISPSSLAPHHLLLCRPNPNLHLNKANASPPPLISSSLFFVSKKSGGGGGAGGERAAPPKVVASSTLAVLHMKSLLIIQHRDQS